jgi:hypothetical protein
LGYFFGTNYAARFSNVLARLYSLFSVREYLAWYIAREHLTAGGRLREGDAG